VKSSFRVNGVYANTIKPTRDKLRLVDVLDVEICGVHYQAHELVL